jgi:hypothetical protein
VSHLSVPGFIVARGLNRLPGLMLAGAYFCRRPFIKRDSRDCMPVPRNVREETMKAILLSLVAVVALAIPVSSPAGAAGADGLRNANAQVHHHRTWSPRKHTYGKRMRAHWGARCKMTGSC